MEERGIRIKWGKLVPGREKQAIDLFTDVMTFFGKKMADDKITYFEPFFVRTADFDVETGFMIFKGPVDPVSKILEEEEYLTLLDRAYYVVEHLQVDYLLVGEGINKQLERSAKVRELLKI